MRVEYVSLKNNDYTGLFQGSKNALLRFSVANPVKPTGSPPDAMAPGLSFKFLRDKVSSANIFAMYSLVGQSSYNFFAHGLTNHVPMVPDDAASLPQKILIDKFFAASKFAIFGGLSNFAEYDESGIRTNSARFPFRLHFHPNSTLHFALPDRYTGVDYETQLKGLIKPGLHLYDVYAQGDPLNEKLVLIGKIIAKSSLTSSNFADKTLFFQHTRFEDDLSHFPGWEKKSQEILDEQGKMKNGGYHYPDLPWK